MKFKTLALTALLTLGMTIQSFAVSVLVNGQPLQSDVPPQIISNRTFVPVSAVASATGATVSWEQATKTVVVQKEGKEIRIQIGAMAATKNGEPVALDAPAQIVNGRTMVPLSFIATSLDVPVAYNAATKTVLVGDISSIPQPAPVAQVQPAQNITQPITDVSEATYIGNSNTKKFHRPDCSSVQDIKPEHKAPISTREDAINAGYIPCKRCNP